MKTNFLKLGLALIAVMAINFGNAQSTTDQANTTTSVRVIDNKGTIKYFQSNNGITQIVNTTTDVTTTTWQLGGTLIDDTTITLNDGTTDNKFVIDGINYSLENIATTSAAAATATTAASGTETGYTLLVRNEATGNVEKLLVSTLIESGHEVITGISGTTAYDLTNGVDLGDFSRVWVYRNGAKLVAGVDYTITDADTITFTEVATGVNSWAIIDGDTIEVQYFK